MVIKKIIVTEELIIKFNHLNNEYGNLHKIVFNRSFIFRSLNRENLDYEKLTHHANELFENLTALRDLFKTKITSQHPTEQTINDTLIAEILAVSALQNYLFGKWEAQTESNYSKKEQREGINKYYARYRDYVRKAKQTQRLLSKK